MNETEIRRMFNELRDNREKIVEGYTSFALEGIWDGVVEKYSEQAHFVYELLQNADDAGASEAKFELYDDKLVFRHNGARHFSVSPIRSEREDYLQNRLGSLNAITAVAKSTKDDDAIGKFGVGFKAVFRYTSNPIIYDKDIKFRIRNYIVPEWMSYDYDGRAAEETIFVLPFDRDNVGGTSFSVPNKKECYDEIEYRLTHLVMPTLFLSNLVKVDFTCASGASGKYSTIKDSEREWEYGEDVEHTKIEVLHNKKYENGKESFSDDLIMFSRGTTPRNRYCVCFRLNEGKIVPWRGFAAFCFFRTQQQTGLDFLIHAPFKLNDAREFLRENDTHNKELIRRLVELLSDSFKYMVRIFDDTGLRCYDDGILDVLPLHRGPTQPIKDFEPFFINSHELPQQLIDVNPVLRIFKEHKVLPTSSGYTQKNRASFADTDQIRNAFPSKILQLLLSNDEAEWAFPGTRRDRTSAADRGKASFIKETVCNVVDYKFILEKTSQTFVKKLCEHDAEWLSVFHGLIHSGQQTLIKDFCKCPIFLDIDDCPSPALDAEGHNILYLPAENGEPVPGFKTVKPDSVSDENSDTSKLLKECGTTRPKRKDAAIAIVRELKKQDLSREDHLAVFDMLVKEFCGGLSDDDRDAIITELKECKFYGKRYNNEDCLMFGRELYFEDETLRLYFSASPKVGFLDMAEYERTVGVQYATKLLELFGQLGVKKLPRKISQTYQGRDSFDEAYKRMKWGEAGPNRTDVWCEEEYEGMLQVLQMLDNQKLPNGGDVSLAVWRVLVELVQEHGEEGFLKNAKHEFSPPKTKIPREEEGLNYLLYRLRSAKWLLSKDGTWVSSRTSDAQSVHENYNGHSPVEIALRNIIGLKDNETTEVLEALKKINPTWADKLRSIMEEEGVTTGNEDNGSTNKENKPVSTEDEEFLALDENITAALGKVQGQPTNRPAAIDVLVDKKAMVITIPQLFSMKLRVPDYQRPYKWGKDNVWDFMDDIKRMVVDKVEGEDGWKARPYRMGSIILHRDEEGIYNIVDGQQRTLTFVLLALAIGVSCDCLNDKDFYPALSQLPVARRNLNNNLRYITDWLKMHGGDCKVKFKNALEKSLQVVVVCVDKRDYAFQLFDSQNVKGRRLEPHDLLKAYHLRELDEAIQLHPERYENVDHGTEDPRLQVVTKWEDYRIQDLSYLFDKLLYPILKWSVKERCYGFTTKDLKAFKGVPQDREGEYGYVDNAFAAAGKYQIGTGFAPGKEFFDMVSHYQDLLNQVRERVARCPSVQSILENASNNAYTMALFEAVLLAYFDRFCLNLPEGEDEINAAIRTLCKWVYSARLDLQYFSPMTPNKYALGVVDGDSKYTNKIAMFFAIRNAVYHSDIAKLTVRMTQSTRESQKTKDRQKLWDLVNAL